MTTSTLEQQVGELLRQLGLTLAVAESCTGGLICHQITNAPGSSDYFLGGVTAYANQAKIDLLGVRVATLEQYGAVSRETVLEMAQGVRMRFGADISLSTSGIAGPGGGTPQKPVGFTWIALCVGDTVEAWNELYAGDRLAVKEQTTQTALRRLRDALLRISE